MADVLVVGGGICGLGTALLLARDGHDVLVLEQDANVAPESPQEAWDQWSRKGVPQFRQPHNFMPGLRRVLEAELPDVQDALREAGAGRFDLLNPQPFADQSRHAIDDQLWTYTARRPVGEWVFARAASEEPSLTIRRGVKVEGLIATTSARDHIPRVAGVRTAAGDELSADLVVDASGRGSRAPRWLESLGARTPHEEGAEHGFLYYTRYFRGEEPQRQAPVLTSIGTISLLTLPGDNGTWSVTVFAAFDDRELKNLRQADRWTRTVRACPRHAHWLDGEPISDVHVMGGILDRRRCLVLDGTPVATGFVWVADAWACTNPSAGRGLTVGFHHAVRLRDALRDGLEDQVEFQLRFDALTERDIAPWYHAQVARDTYRFAEIEALRRGDEPPAPDPAYLPIHNLLTFMSADPVLFRATLEYIGTLTPVEEILKRVEVQERMSAVLERMKDAPPPALPGPDRAQLLALVS